MLKDVSMALRRRWRGLPLNAKVMVPSAALVLVMWAAAVGVASWGRHVIQNRGLREHAEAELQLLAEAVAKREASLETAAADLAQVPVQLQAGNRSGAARSAASEEEVAQARDRFDLLFAQVSGEDPVGALAAERSSTVVSGDPLTGAVDGNALLNLAEPGRVVARVVGDRLILLASAAPPGGTGTILVGTDVGADLERVRQQEGIGGCPGIAVRGLRVGAQADLPVGVLSGWVGDQYVVRQGITIGGTNAELLLAQPSGGARELGRLFLSVTAGTSLLMAVGIVGLSALGWRSLVRPIAELSSAAKVVANGGYRQVPQASRSPLLLGSGDELGELGEAFDRMTRELRALRSEMDERVEERTLELAVVATVARVVSTTLDLKATLQGATDAIRAGSEALYPGIRQVGVYLVDERAQAAVLEAVSADEEADLTCRALSIPLGCRSPVGLAAATMRPEVIENARVSGAHLKPPLLMDTLSAVALPLIHEDTLLGVLELQSASPEVFGSAPPPVLVSLADQIAAVIRNAQIYEAQRQKAERLGESDQLRSHLLTVMSHKLRAPLNTIIGLSGALLDTDRDKLTDRQRRDIGLIHTLGRHLGELTDDLLDPPAGTPVPIELHREEVDLRLLVESAIHSVRPLLDSKGLEMKACLEADLPVIRADKRRVRQVLLRLLSRLAARTESGGIDVRARQTSALGAAGNEAELCVEVSVGVQGGTIHREVPMGSVPRIGADEHGHSDRNGSDRDLAIVEAVVAVHGGQFWAEGGPGDGTTYTFTLPLGQRD